MIEHFCMIMRDCCCSYNLLILTYFEYLILYDDSQLFSMKYSSCFFLFINNRLFIQKCQGEDLFFSAQTYIYYIYCTNLIQFNVVLSQFVMDLTHVVVVIQFNVVHSHCHGFETRWCGFLWAR